MSALQSVRRNSTDDGNEAYDTRASRPLFEDMVTRTTTASTEQTMHRFTVSRNQFKVNGDRIMFNYTFTTDASAGDVYCRIKFAGTTLFDSGVQIDPSLGNNQVLTINGWISRKNRSTVRYSVQGITTLSIANDAVPKQGEITGLEFPDSLGISSGTAYDLLATIETPDAAGDASITMAEARFVNAAQCDLVTTGLWAYGEARYYKGILDGNGDPIVQYADGSSITTDWQDLSGNARHAVRTGTPTFKTAQINGEAAVRLPGGTVYFTFPDMSGLTAAAIYLALRVNDVTTNGGNKLGSYAGNDCYYPYTPDSPDGIYEAFGSTTRKSCGGSIILPGPAPVIERFHVLYMWSKANDWGLKQDQMSVYETATNTFGGSSAPRLGHNGADGMKVDIAGWWIYSAKPTDANEAKQHRYIQQVLGC